MAMIAEKHRNRLKDIKKNIESWHDYWQENVKIYWKMKTAVFKTAITERDKEMLQKFGRPNLEANGLEKEISRAKGKFAENTLSPIVKSSDPAKANPEFEDVISGHLRSINETANDNQFQNQILNDTLAGGYSVAFVGTEYVNEMSFQQTIKMESVFDPTLCGFDPMARDKTKKDGRYCFEMFPMLKEEVEDMFNIDLGNCTFSRSIGNYNWFYRNGSQKVLLVCHYYEKKPVKKKILYLASGETMTADDYQNKYIDNWEDVIPPPNIIKERKTEIEVICRYTLIGDRVLDYKETSYPGLPYVFFDGNSQMLREGDEGSNYEMIRPLVYHAIGMQRSKNMLLQTFINEVQRLSQASDLIAEESMPTAREFQQAWKQTQAPKLRVWRSRDDKGEPNVEPKTIPRQTIPPQIFQALSASDELMRNIMSGFDPHVALNSGDISGKAIIEGVAESNEMVKPYLINFIAGLNRVYEIVLDLIPKYYKTPMTIPITDSEGKRSYQMVNQDESNQMNWNKGDLNVVVDAGVSLGVQKQRSLETMARLSQAFPIVGEFLQEKGLPYIIKNLEIDGKDQMAEDAAEFMQEKEQMQMQAQQAAQQGAGQPNPEIMDMQLKAQKQQLDQKKAQADIENERMRIGLEQQKINQNERKINMQGALSAHDQRVQEEKAETERLVKSEELAMRRATHMKNMTSVDDNMSNTDESV